jgi:hypothetical protein
MEGNKVMSFDPKTAQLDTTSTTTAKPFDPLTAKLPEDQTPPTTSAKDPSYIERVGAAASEPGRKMNEALKNLQEVLPQAMALVGSGNHAGAAKLISPIAGIINSFAAVPGAVLSPVTEAPFFGPGARNVLGAPAAIAEPLVTAGGRAISAGMNAAGVPQTVQNLGLSDEEAARAGNAVHELNTNAATMLLPEGVVPAVRGVRKGVATAVEKLGGSRPLSERLYQSALKPPVGTPGTSEAMVKTGVDYRVPISRKGIEENFQAISKLGEQVQTTIEGGSKSGESIFGSDLTSGLEDLRNKGRVGLRPDEALKDIRDVSDAIKNHPLVNADMKQTLMDVAGAVRETTSLKGKLTGGSNFSPNDIVRLREYRDGLIADNVRMGNDLTPEDASQLGNVTRVDNIIKNMEDELRSNNTPVSPQDVKANLLSKLKGIKSKIMEEQVNGGSPPEEALNSHRTGTVQWAIDLLEKQGDTGLEQLRKTFGDLSNPDNVDVSFHPSAVQGIKQDIYKRRESAYSETGVKRSTTTTAAEKSVANHAKVELEKLFPEIKGLNAEDGARIELQDALRRAVSRKWNTNILTTGHTIAGVGVGLGTALASGGNIPAALAATAIAVLIDNPLVKTKLAFALSKARKLQIGNAATRNVRTVTEVGGVAGGRSTHSDNDRNQAYYPGAPRVGQVQVKNGRSMIYKGGDPKMEKNWKKK